MNAIRITLQLVLLLAILQVAVSQSRLRTILNRLFPRRFVYEQDAPVVYRVVHDPTQVRRMTVTRDNLFGWLNLKNYVRFHLWTRQNPELAHELLVGDEESLRTSYFNPERLTKIFVHGYQDNANEVSIGDWQVFGRNAYLKLGDVNVMAVDYSFFATTPFYLVPMHELVAEKLKDLLLFLMKHGLRLESVHLIGWSWGAHASGLAGQHLNGSIGRITGLDPAGPLFKLVDEEFRLDKSDAKFVDVIHSNAGTRLFWGGHFGHPDPLGHVDVFPNGGERQTGCPMEHTFNVGSLLCNHGRANRYFVESILAPLAFPMCPCESYDHLIRNDCACSLEESVFMGEHLSHKARGTFWIITRAHNPYGHGPQLEIETLPLESVTSFAQQIKVNDTEVRNNKNMTTENKTETMSSQRNATLTNLGVATLRYKNVTARVRFNNHYNVKYPNAYPNDEIVKMSLSVFRKFEVMMA